MKKVILAAAMIVAASNGARSSPPLYDCEKDAAAFGSRTGRGGAVREKVYAACEAVNACVANCSGNKVRSCIDECRYDKR